MARAEFVSEALSLPQRWAVWPNYTDGIQEVVTTEAAAVIVPRVKASTWSAIATWLPIGISLISLVISIWFGVIRSSRQAKAANPTAQADLLNYETKSGWHEEV